MKFFTIVALLLSFSISSTAQDTTEPTAKTLNNDIGFGTAIIFQGLLSTPSSLPFSILYKRYKSENQAFRIGLSTTINVGNSDGTLNPPGRQENSSYNISLTLGKEKQHLLTRKWLWYYGGDIIPMYRYTKTQTSTSNSTVITNELGMTARPFAGFRFNISAKLYLSTEFSGNLSYSHRDYKETTNQITTAESSTNTYLLSLVPANSIFIFYRF